MVHNVRNCRDCMRAENHRDPSTQISRAEVPRDLSTTLELRFCPSFRRRCRRRHCLRGIFGSYRCNETMSHSGNPSAHASCEPWTRRVRIRGRTLSTLHSGTDLQGTHTCPTGMRWSSTSGRPWHGTCRTAWSWERCNIGPSWFGSPRIVCNVAHMISACLGVGSSKPSCRRPATSLRSVVHPWNFCLSGRKSHHEDLR